MKIKPIRETIQNGSVSIELRNGIWDCLHIHVLGNPSFHPHDRLQLLKSSSNDNLFKSYWHDYFKVPIDKIPSYYSDALKYVRDYFMKCEWHEMYDFIDYTLSAISSTLTKNNLSSHCNKILCRELSAYRIVNNQVMELTSEQEIACLETAIDNTSAYIGARKHLETAIKLLSDRVAPDYRNSIKESVCAIESIAKELTGDSNATLGAALGTLEKNGELHPALKKSFSALYGYVSDADGIRHAMLDSSTIDNDDARFMLISCSAFMNYLIAKNT